MEEHVDDLKFVDNGKFCSPSDKTMNFNHSEFLFVVI